MERETERIAAREGYLYINLFGFPISPEALVLIPEEKANELGVVCFLYDGNKIRFGAFDPKSEEIIKLKPINGIE